MTGHKAQFLWAFVAVDPQGDEGPVAFGTNPENAKPMITSKMEIARGALADVCEKLAEMGHPRIELRRYELKEVERVFPEDA